MKVAKKKNFITLNDNNIFLKFLLYSILINKKNLIYPTRLQDSIISFLSLNTFYKSKIENKENYE